MTKYHTNNALGSTDPRDLFDNAQNLDHLTNDQSKESHPDRLGVERKTWHGMEVQFDSDQVSRATQFDADQEYRENAFVASQADKQSRFNDFIASSGYQFLGDYAAGIEITEYNQIVRDSNGEFWRLSGQEELPYTTTGAGLPEDDALTPLGDAVLRQQLADDITPGLGSSMLSATRRGIPYAITQEEKNNRTISIMEFIPSAERAAIIEGTSTYDTTAAFNDMAAYARTLVAPNIIIDPGEYFATGTIALDLPDYSTVTFNGYVKSTVTSGPAIRIGSTDQVRWQYRVYGVAAERSPFDTQPGGSIGVEIADLVYSEVDVRRATGFSNGLLCSSKYSAGGFSYNKIYLGNLRDNHCNVKLESTGSGYVNENSFFGGSLGYSQSYANPEGTVDLHIKAKDGSGSGANNNRFFGTSFEAWHEETRAAIIEGRYTILYHPRCERGVSQNSFIFEFTSSSSHCAISGPAFGIRDSNILDNGSNNSFETRSGFIVNKEAGSDEPIYRISSTASNSAKAISVYNVSQSTETYYVRPSGVSYVSDYSYAGDGFRWRAPSGGLGVRGLFSGSANPEGNQVAAIGSVYFKTNSSGPTAWVKKIGNVTDTGWRALQQVNSANTAARPTDVIVGWMYFDTSIGRPIWFNGTDWVDSEGDVV